MNDVPYQPWELSFGDATVIGWSITLAYFACVWIVLRAAARAHALRGRVIDGALIGEGIVRLWCLVALILFFLGVNKELDLQRLFLEIARDVAREGGWYEDRKPLQIAALVVVISVSISIAGWMLWVLRRHARAIWPAVAGVVILGAFIGLRTSSHHGMDALMKAGPIPLRDSMEFMGMAPIAWSAWRFGRRR